MLNERIDIRLAIPIRYLPIEKLRKENDYHASNANNMTSYAYSFENNFLV